MRTCLAITFGLVSMSASAGTISIADWSQDSLSEWEAKSFSGNTSYQIISSDNQKVLKATSRNSASGIALERKIDLLATPYLKWSWSSDSKLSNLNEQSKQGDDYVARIYVVISGGWQMWKTKALNYVWSSNQPQGQRWNNAFAGENAKMIAVKGKEAMQNQWYQESRNVYQDLIKAYGDKGSDAANQKAYRYIDAIAIMTDTDNSKQSATALYGDISFSSEL